MKSAAEPIESSGPSPLHLVQDAPASGLDATGLTYWGLAFGAFAATAGHGLFLLLALTRLERIPNTAELGGLPNALLVGWFVLSMPLAAWSFLRRSCLIRWPQGRLRAFAWGACAISALAFALYVRKMVLA